MTIIQSPAQRKEQTSRTPAEHATRPLSAVDESIAETRKWMESPRFAGITRLYSARQVVEQRGTIQTSYTVAKSAAESFYSRLRELLEGARPSPPSVRIPPVRQSP